MGFALHLGVVLTVFALLRSRTGDALLTIAACLLLAALAWRPSPLRLFLLCWTVLALRPGRHQVVVPIPPIAP